MHRENNGLRIILKLHDVGRVQIVSLLQKSIDVFLERLLFRKSLFLLQIQTKLQNLVQITHPLSADIFVNELHIYFLIN